jgi:regulator of protease activity HflC (stomatin/prohibitin superfamily)
MRSTVRNVAGRYTAEEIYSTKRNEVETTMITETAEVLKVNNIDMRALLIRSIILPEGIKKAIEMKLTREQESLAMVYVKEKEAQEADRKRIEAQGVSDYNRILSASLNDKILKQKGIDATLKLAESANAKVVVIGSGKDGMPLILGGN